MSESQVFDLDRFHQQMDEMTRLQEREMAILDEMLRDLGIDPEQLEADKNRRRLEESQARSARRIQRRGNAPARQENPDMVKTRTVSEAARKVLSRCVVEDDAIQLPRGEDGSRKMLNRELYDELNGVLEALGGTWTRRREAHVFTEPTGTELADRFYTVVETGTWERPQDSGYYPTPDWLAAKMVELADVAVNHRVLEPSAGQGAILRHVKKLVFNGAQISVCELLPDNQKELKKLGFDVDAEDFLTLDVGPMFDRVLMNPPFSRSQAPIHVRHAIRQLKPGGKLVAIMPAGIMQRQDKLHREVRAELIRNGKVSPLPDDAFKDAGTMVRTVLVVYQKPMNDEPFKIVATTTSSPVEPPTMAQEGQNGTGVPESPARRFRKAQRVKFKRLKRPSFAGRRKADA